MPKREFILVFEFDCGIHGKNAHVFDAFVVAQGSCGGPGCRFDNFGRGSFENRGIWVDTSNAVCDPRGLAAEFRLGCTEFGRGGNYQKIVLATNGHKEFGCLFFGGPHGVST